MLYRFTRLAARERTGCNIGLALLSFLVFRIRKGEKIADSPNTTFLKSGTGAFSFELFHDQLPLAVPCYDLLPVTEFTVVWQAKLWVFPVPLS